MENNYHFGHLEEFRTFNSVEELNHHVNGFRDKTTATEFKVLWFISKYAVKLISVSIKTVQRAIKSLIDYGSHSKGENN